MKFEDLLMQRGEEQQKRLDLEEEVMKLQGELNGEQALNRVLRFALEGPVSSHPSLFSLLPPQVQVLLEELVVVQEEIIWLERKIEELKLRLYQEREQNRGTEIEHLRDLPKDSHLLCGPENRAVLNDQRSRSQNYDEFRKERITKERRPSLGSVSEILSMSSTRSQEEYHMSRRHTRRLSRNQCHINKETGLEKPNELSEKLIKCLISIFLELNHTSVDREGSVIAPKLSLACMKSKGFVAKTTFNCRTPTLLFAGNASNLDPYSVLSDFDGTVRDVGQYKNLIQITRSSLDISRLSECLPAMRRLRVLMHKLSYVDLTFLTYKQKLAFWINVYNACIMHAFLDHGLPSTQAKLLAIMNKAVVNVGGIVLNVLAIEHFILRHPWEPKQGHPDEKETLLRHAYGLGYPEPNVTFALCRGSWSSPAFPNVQIRVYTPNEVVNELGRAKVEYLEASVGVTSKRKIVVPKLLQWHMRDFADDMESLLEWIYSQLPRSGSLKRLMMECLNGETRSPISRMVEIQPYESEFRYLFPS
ncbi:hypothetical protein F2P56_017148 [Juglans regia]|uniref:Uncharacterized protein LOC108986345 isoform X1 n=2 Tax=Juglans regia TaxID=51240 RepID=A0A2I4E4Y9_JUGRE|nr:uncharacterized protein LOC108986345 isoform X1 [Juglans regia]KAF5467314.1 hypothetical protein F2P56_017148 [Juglans regia]